MTLEALLKPVKSVDTEIHRYYTKFGKKWEDQGHSRYSIAIPLSLYGGVMGFGLNLNQHLVGWFLGWDTWSNLSKTPYGTKENFSLGAITINRSGNFLKTIDRIARFPLFAAGVGYMVKGTYGVVHSIAHGDNSELGNSVSEIGTGSSLFAMASSLYIKDIEPKLLDKQPFWKTAYHWAKEKVSSLAPQPAPQPIPIQSYTTLENCIHAQPQ